MSLFISSLNSGSNGELLLYRYPEEPYWSMGISCRETERRLKRLHYPSKRVKAIFVTHEHSDHVYGVSHFQRKYINSPFIYRRHITRWEIEAERKPDFFLPGLRTDYHRHLSVTAFPKFTTPATLIALSWPVQRSRWASSPIWVPCEHVIRHFWTMWCGLLGANYDEQMLDTVNILSI